MTKTLYILIGPKGAGKSHIGALLSSATGVHFLRVEPIWVRHLSAGGTQDAGWKVVEGEIDRLFETVDEVVIETLGAGDGFAGFHVALQSKYHIKRIKVQADLEECLRRVKHRDSANHIPVSDDRVAEYNRIAAKVEYPWDLVIDNDGPAPADQIVALFAGLRQHGLRH